MAVRIWDDEFKQYIPAIMDKSPVAWRWRHGHRGPWTYGDERPAGPSIHLFVVEPLYSGDDGGQPTGEPNEAT